MLTKITDKHASRLFLAACILCGCAILAVYLPGLPGAFVFDDIGNIVGNPALRIPDLSPNSLVQAMLSAPGGGLLRPLSMLSFALDAYFFGLSPFAFKLTNILIHISCAVVLGFVARELLLAYTAVTRRELSPPTIAWLSLAAATLWALHPLDLTAVLYIVQRDTSLAALCSAGAILCYLLGRRRMREDRGRRAFIWLGTPLLMAAGLMCKENAALVPVFLLVIEFTLLGLRARDGRISREVAAFFGLFLLLPGIAVCLATVLRPALLFGSYAGRGYDMYQRLLTESRVFWDYLRWTLLPDPRQLALFHDDIAPSLGLLQPATTLAGCIGLSGLLALAFWLRRRLPLLSLGLLWFFAGHLMESTVLPLELVFEHRNYLPLFGLIFGILGTIYPWAQSRGMARLTQACFTAFLLLMAGITASRASDWQTEISFARAESIHHPDSPRALAELEWAYLNYIVVTRDTSLIPAAVAAAEHSKQADGHSINQDVSLAYMFGRLGQLPDAHLHLGAAAEAAKSATPSATLQFALQTLLDMGTQDNATLFPDIATVFRDALANPALLRDDCYTANMWNSYGLFSQRIEEIQTALGAMHRAVTLCPTQGQLRANFARMLLLYGDLPDAKRQLDALAALHDTRRRWELQELQAGYAAQLQKSPH